MSDENHLGPILIDAHFRPAPDETVENGEAIHAWIIDTAVRLGNVCAQTVESLGASDRMFSLVLHYLAGRCAGIHLGDQPYGETKKARYAMKRIYYQGIEEGRTHRREVDLRGRANANTTETMQ